MITQNRLELICIKTINEIAAYKNIWDVLLPSPLASIEYIELLNKHNEKIISPYIVIAVRDKIPEAVATGMIEQKELNFEIVSGLKKKIPVRVLRFREGSISGLINRDTCSAVIGEIYQALRLKEADMTSFDEVPVDSNLFIAAKKIPGILGRDHFPKIDWHYKMKLPDKLEDILKGKKNRERVRRYLNKIDKDFKKNYRFENIKELDQLNRFCKDAERISMKTHRFEHGYKYLNNEENSGFLENLARKGLFRGYMLYIRNEPTAYWVGFIHNKTLVNIPYGGTGYDLEYKKYSVGRVVMWKMVEDLIKDEKVEYIDFGLGDLEYKRSICDIKWQDAVLNIYGPNIKGATIKTLKSLGILYNRYKRKKQK